MGEGEEWGRGVLSLNTLRPDRINYSDVSICQRVPVARLRDSDPNGTNGEIRGGRGGRGRRRGGKGRRKKGGEERGMKGERGEERRVCAPLPYTTSSSSSTSGHQVIIRTRRGCCLEEPAADWRRASRCFFVFFHVNNLHTENNFSN